MWSSVLQTCVWGSPAWGWQHGELNCHKPPGNLYTLCSVLFFRVPFTHPVVVAEPRTLWIRSLLLALLLSDVVRLSCWSDAAASFGSVRGCAKKGGYCLSSVIWKRLRSAHQQLHFLKEIQSVCWIYWGLMVQLLRSQPFWRGWIR